MKRFKTSSSSLPVQPRWEVLSERVVCILGMNPSTFTLNGTCCYLVGTGKKRLLIDAAESSVGLHAFLQALSEAMTATGCLGLDGVIITHAHHDHYGGLEAVQERWGPNLPVYTREEPLQRAQRFLTTLEEKGNGKTNNHVYGCLLLVVLVVVVVVV